MSTAHGKTLGRSRIEHPLRVMVVEDQEFQRRWLVALLTRIGAGAVMQAGDGQAALTQLQHGNTVDVVITDLQMAGMDGVSFLRELAAVDFPPAVIISSAVHPELLLATRAMADGLGLTVLGSLRKPYTFEQLLPLLRNFLWSEEASTTHLQVEEMLPLEEIQQAMDHCELLPYYQPKLELAGGKVHGVEALARWRHPRYGLLKPARFLPMIDHFQHGLALTLHMLQQAMMDCQHWSLVGIEMPLSINLSTETLLRQELPDRLEALVLAAGMKTGRITLEVNESAVLADMTKALEVAVRLRMKGFGLSLDDFGTGFATISSLSQLPFTEIKIDPRYVQNADTEKGFGLLQTLCEMGRRMGLRTVAESVETADDLQRVRKAGGDLVQGFQIAIPMPADELLVYLRSRV